MELLAINENYLNNYNKLSDLDNNTILDKLNAITSITDLIGGVDLINYDNNIAILKINGALINKQNIASILLGGNVAYNQIVDIINSIDTNIINKLIIHIDSPGGMVQGIETVINAINHLSIPKFAFIDNMACSNGYLLASLCDKIYSFPSALIGSIGTVIQYENISKQLDQDGVEIIYFRGGGKKQKPNSIENLTDSDKDYLQDLVNSAYTDFYTLVANNRDLDINYLDNWADGQVFEAKKGIEIGLVDKLVLSLNDVINDINNDNLLADGSPPANNTVEKMEYNIIMDNTNLQSQYDELNAKFEQVLAKSVESEKQIEALKNQLLVAETEPLLAQFEQKERDIYASLNMPADKLKALLEARNVERIIEPISQARTVNLKGMVNVLPTLEVQSNHKKTVAEMIIERGAIK